MSFSNQSLEAFTAALASGAPTPGGGGVSALLGALAAALGNMVGNLTAGKKTYAAVEADILALNARAEALRGRFLALITRDAEAFAPLAAAYKLPKDDPAREAVMEEALCGAAAAPLEIMEACRDVIELLEEYARKGSALAVSDAGVGALCGRAALCGAALNVFVNTQLMRDKTRAAGLERRADALLAEYVPRADAVYARVTARLREREG